MYSTVKGFGIQGSWTSATEFVVSDNNGVEFPPGHPMVKGVRLGRREIGEMNLLLLNP